MQEMDVKFRIVAKLKCGVRGDIVRSVAFNPSGKYLASGSGDNIVRVWDVSSMPMQQVAKLEGHKNAVTSVAFDPSGKYLASGSHDNTIRLWDVVTQQQVAELKCGTGYPGWVRCIAFDPSGKYLALGSSDNTVRVWDVASQQQLAELKGYKSSVTSVAFDSSRKYLASGSLDKSVVLWEVPERLDQQVSELEGVRALGRGVFSGEVADFKVLTSEVESVAFDPTGKYLASGCADKTVRVWDVSSMPMQQVAELKGHTDIVLSVAFESSGKYLASGSYDNTVRVWDVASQQQVAELKGHMDDQGPGRYNKHGCEAAVFSVAFDPSGMYLASGSYDGTVSVWDMTTAPELDELADDAADAARDTIDDDNAQAKDVGKGGRRSRKRNNRNKKRVKTLKNKKKISFVARASFSF